MANQLEPMDIFNASIDETKRHHLHLSIFNYSTISFLPVFGINCFKYSFFRADQMLRKYHKILLRMENLWGLNENIRDKTYID